MTEQTWNEDQIEAAVRQVLSAPESQQVMDKLTKSKPVIKKGEVYYHPSDGAYYKSISDRLIGTERRRLTPDEVPGWARDKAALKAAIEYIEVNEYRFSQPAILAKIKDLTDV